MTAVSAHASGLTPRSVLENFKTVSMIGVHPPISDDRVIILPRYTQPEAELQLLLRTLRLQFAGPLPPTVTS